jgi:tripartite-type tricarboxylate transporter receptor subunit TctC
MVTHLVCPMEENMWQRFARTVLALVAALALLAPAAAQDPSADYPSKPVKIIVTVPAGGGVDTVTRLFAEELHQRLGQPFVVDNRGGAGGNVAAEAVYTSPPDGYTLMASQPAPITTNVALYKKLSFDPTKFEPVAVMTKFPNVLLVRNDFPAKTAQEFIAYAKANSGKLNFASQGVGTTSHLTAELFMALTGVKMTHVPYRGTGPALNDIVAGHVDLIFMELSSAYKLHDAGKARVLAVATDKRLDMLKDTPTMIEVGVPGFVSDTWNAISAPPRTPAPIVAKLNRTMNDIINQDDMKKRFHDLHMVPVGGSPEDMRKLVEEETRRWGDVIRKAGIQPE